MIQIHEAGTASWRVAVYREQAVAAPPPKFLQLVAALAG
jgi:hypothetical protein